MFDLHQYLQNPKVMLAAHLMVWHGLPGHVPVGYRSSDVEVQKRQIERMQSFGIGCVIPNVRGLRGTHRLLQTRTAENILRLCETMGMKFAWSWDKDIYNSFPATEQQAVLDTTLEYYCLTSLDSPAYLRMGAGTLEPGPVAIVFPDKNTVNWASAKKVRSDLRILGLNASSFSNPMFDGAYSWVNPGAAGWGGDNIGEPYITDFIARAKQFPNKIKVYHGHPGFDDSDPANPANSIWPGNNPARVMKRFNGRTFIRTLEMCPSDAELIQIVTWNDYDEQSAIEASFAQPGRTAPAY